MLCTNKKLAHKYKLSHNGFTAPNGKEFKTWSVGGKELAPNEEIKVLENTVVKAVWKAKETPKTGDSNNVGLFVGLGGVALLAIIALVVIMLKKKTYK